MNFQTGSETSYSVHRVNIEVCAELDVIRGDNETSLSYHIEIFVLCEFIENLSSTKKFHMVPFSCNATGK